MLPFLFRMFETFFFCIPSAECPADPMDSMATARTAGLGSMPITAEQFATTLENMSRAWEATTVSAAWFLEKLCILHHFASWLCRNCFSVKITVITAGCSTVRSSGMVTHHIHFIGSVVQSWYVIHILSPGTSRRTSAPKG